MKKCLWQRSYFTVNSGKEKDKKPSYR